MIDGEHRPPARTTHNSIFFWKKVDNNSWRFFIKYIYDSKIQNSIFRGKNDWMSKYVISNDKFSLEFQSLEIWKKKKDRISKIIGRFFFNLEGSILDKQLLDLFSFPLSLTSMDSPLKIILAHLQYNIFFYFYDSLRERKK